ncbi:MAG TPA: sigma-70 factor domain-containing protein, partial [Ilumatobacteraceae bacterium]|nr:sigma-70 factor domain-containing protein [Ilumatobacteraceae bacterium]
MNDSIGLYLNDIGKVSLLNAEEERQLSRVIEAGRDAAERLANGEKGAALKAAVAADVKSQALFDLGQQMTDMVFSFSEL